MNFNTNRRQLIIIFLLLNLLYPLYASKEIKLVPFKQSPFKQKWRKTLELGHKERAPSSVSILSEENTPVKIIWAIDRQIKFFDMNGTELANINNPFKIETAFLTKDERTMVLIGKENIARLNLETRKISKPIPLPLIKVLKNSHFRANLEIKGEEHFWIGGIITNKKHFIGCFFIFDSNGILKLYSWLPMYPMAGVTEKVEKGNDLIEILWIWNFTKVICVTSKGEGIYQYDSGLKFFLGPNVFPSQGICKISSGKIAAVFIGSPGAGLHPKSLFVRFVRMGGRIETSEISLDHLYTAAVSRGNCLCFAGSRIKFTNPGANIEATASLVFTSNGKPVEKFWESSCIPLRGYFLDNRPSLLTHNGNVIVLDHAFMPLWQENSNLVADLALIPLDLDRDKKADDFLIAGRNNNFGENNQYDLLAIVNQEEAVAEKALLAYQYALGLLKHESGCGILDIFRETEKKQALNAFREAASLLERVDMQKQLKKARIIIRNLEICLKRLEKMKRTIARISGGTLILLTIILVVYHRNKIRGLFVKAVQNGTRKIMRIRMFSIPEVEDLYRSQDHLRDRLKHIRENANQLQGDFKDVFIKKVLVQEAEVNALRHRMFFPRLSEKVSMLETELFQASEKEEAARYRVPFQPANPAVYPVGRPIEDIHLYCGRSRHFRELSRALTCSESIIVHGQFRIGKTSILRLTKEKLLETFPCVYYDAGLLQFGEKKLNGWLKILGESCDEALRIPSFSRWLSQKSTVEMNAPDIGQQFLKEWLYPLKRQTGNIIILFDEFQHVLDTIDSSVSGLIKHIVENSLLTLVFCVRSKASLPAEHNVFNSTGSLHIGQLDDHGIEELLSLPERLFGHRYSTAAKRRLKQLTGGHPYYLQVAHVVLAERLNAEKTNFLRQDAHIDETTINKIIERLETHFRTEWMHLSSIERRIILELVHGRFTLSEAELFDRIFRGKDDNSREFTAALNNLKEVMQIISATGQQYAMKIGLWSQWVRNQSAVELLRKGGIKNVGKTSYVTKKK